MAFSSACSHNVGAPTEPPTPEAGVQREPPAPSAVPGPQGTQGANAETPQLQTIDVADVSLPHFDCAAQADVNATVAVTTGISIDGGLVLEPGDEIAIFTPNGDICAGSAVWPGENIAITAWGDDSQTEGVDGLVNGDSLHFRIWDASEQVEYQVTAVDYQEGDGIFVEDGIYIVGAFTIQE